jgi:hypothetical protein
MNRRTHKTAKHAHAKQRAHEHFGISLTKAKINDIIKQIESGKAEFVDDDWVNANPRETYLVSLEGLTVRVVYEPYSRTLITVTPHNTGDFF